MYPGRYDFGQEANETSIELQGDLGKLVPLTEEELSEMLPSRTDQEQLKSLIDSVSQQSTMNAKKTVFLDRLGTVSAIVKTCALKIIGTSLG